MWDNVLVPTCKLRSASLRVTCPSCDHSSSCFISHAWIASWISVDMIRIVRQSVLELYVTVTSHRQCRGNNSSFNFCYHFQSDPSIVNKFAI